VSAFPSDQYIAVADSLTDRIRALDPAAVSACVDAWALFKVHGFHCADLQPSLFQAQFALHTVQREIAAKATP
jgi:hypothetical protein